METDSQAKGKKLPKPNNIFVVPTSEESDFFKWWCVYLRPFVNLTNKELEVVASLLRHRYELSKHISDSNILDSVVMSDQTRKKVLEDCGITMSHFHVILSVLRKHKIIINNVINPRMVPNIREDDNGTFQLLVLFKDSVAKAS